jgi:anti-sigma28 factor (negative regulator of flagellin synthesis)
MEKIITKHRFKYSHAYDEFCNCIGLENAINDKRPYFFDRGKQIKLYLATSSNGYLHWRAYPKQTFVDKNGIEYDYTAIENKLSESPEHLIFKRSIVERGYFTFQRNKVYIQNAVEEERIINSRYESDVSGQLLDGTPCIVEVIKTSDLSAKKLEHIEGNQILTFKIYIDEYGNQIPESDNIVGNREIKQIKESIQDGEGKFAEIREANFNRRREANRESEFRIAANRNEIERRIFTIKEKFSYDLSRFETWLNERLESLRNTVKERRGKLRGGQEIGERIRVTKEHIQKNKGEQRAIEQDIDFRRKRIYEIRESIIKLESEVKNIENEIEGIENINWYELMENLTIVDSPFKLNPFTNILNVKYFIDGHKSIILGTGNYKFKRPYMKRIIEYKNLTDEQR